MIVYALLAVSLIVLIIIGVPVGFGAGIISTIGAANFFGDFADPRVSGMIARSAFAKIDNFLLLAIPFFLLAGRLMNTGGITNRLFHFVSITVRPLKGGLGHANVLASMIFAGMSGSATADAVGLGTVEMRAMLEQGYDRKFSAAITAHRTDYSAEHRNGGIWGDGRGVHWGPLLRGNPTGNRDGVVVHDLCRLLRLSV